MTDSPEAPESLNNLQGQLLKTIEPSNTTCNCRDRPNCPLKGKCLESAIVYQATVTATNPTTATETKETYIGLTDTTFKIRYGNHKQSFKNEKLKNATELSKHIWILKEKKTDYTIEWTIVDKAKSYNNSSKRCHLCLQENFYILCHPELASLNQKSGIINSCRHKNKFLLSKHPT